MKFKCLNNDGWEHLVTVGKIYEGKYSEAKDDLGKYYVVIFKSDDGLEWIGRNYRFEEVE